MPPEGVAVQVAEPLVAMLAGETEQVPVTGGTGAVTVTAVQGPQLLFSLLSTIAPLFEAEDLSAHART